MFAHIHQRIILIAAAVCLPVFLATVEAAGPALAIALNSGDGTLSLIDTETYRVVGKTQVCKEPHHLMPSPDDKSVIVACAASNQLVFFDPLTGKEQKRIRDISDPYHLGFSPDRKLFVSNSLRLDRVDFYDTADFKLKARVHAPRTPSHMAFDAAGEMVFITLQDSNEVMAISLKTLKTEWVIPVGPTPAGIVMTPDNRYLLVAILDVGLEYVKLGQPVPTLSGGEAQRLKLAGFLAEAAKSSSASRQALARRGVMFMFDEPTTGLHFDDIAKLMRALRKLLDAGHSLLVIEHNLDVIRASDWLIDLGPEGGDAGGEVVAFGTPEDVMLHATSHTGLALRDYAAQMGVVHEVAEVSAKYLSVVRAAAGGRAPGFSDVRFAASTSSHGVSPPPVTLKVGAGQNPMQDAIQIINAREHNLKGLSVNIPRGKFNVVTGVSGSK